MLGGGRRAPPGGPWAPRCGGALARPTARCHAAENDEAAHHMRVFPASGVCCQEAAPEPDTVGARRGDPRRQTRMRWRVSTSGLAPSGLGWPITEVVEPTADDAEGLGWPATEPSPGAVAASREPSDGASDEGIPTSGETFSRETAASDVSRETSASPEASECASLS